MLESKEDYLRVIHELYEDCKYRNSENNEKGINAVDVAKRLKISKASVSEMLRKLAKQNLVKIKPYSKISLTPKGKREAEKIHSKHESIKNFIKMIGHEDKAASNEADKLEHAFSYESLEKLKDFLEKPVKKALPSYIG